MPYKINEEESEIAEGKYNEENKTITWTEEITGVDTYIDPKAKEIENYRVAQINGQEEGTFGKGRTEITYKETKEDGTTQIKTYSYEIKGYVGDKYKTEEKQIPYYNLVKTPTIQGKPEEQNIERELTENGETIIYYYKKKTFNIAVEKELKRVVFNEEEKTIRNKKAIKIEIVASTIKQANLEVTYSIKVKNTVKITKTTNLANFEETNLDDNEATAEIITSIKTGAEEKIILSISTTAMILVAILLVYLYKKYNKERGKAITTIKIENGKLVIKKE